MVYNKALWREYLPLQTSDFDPVEKSGVLIINKPPGLSSMDVIRIIRKVGKIKKVGHAGTLDPMATGVLPVLINRATKLSNTLMAGSKEYDGTITFGQEYDTQDITGAPTGSSQELAADIGLAQLNKAALILTGEIDQIPPIYSAIKKDGKPLYEYARASRSVEIQTRKVYVEKFEITGQIDSKTFAFYVSCGKGVYVRTLAHDLGRLIGCPAALSSLRRLRVGKFLIENSVDLGNLKTPEDIANRLINPEDFL